MAIACTCSAHKYSLHMCSIHCTIGAAHMRHISIFVRVNSLHVINVSIIGGGYMDAWMNFSVLPGVMGLVVCDIFYHICDPL